MIPPAPKTHARDSTAVVALLIAVASCTLDTQGSAGGFSDAGPLRDSGDRAGFGAASDASGTSGSSGGLDSGRSGSGAWAGSGGDSGSGQSGSGAAAGAAGSAATGGASVDSGPCPGSDAACLDDVPTGWKLVAFASSTTPSCPVGFAPPIDVDTDASLGTFHCSCACTVTTPPDCLNPQVTFWISNSVGQQCSTSGLSVKVNGPTCVPINGSFANYVTAKASAPTSAGTCSVSAEPSGQIEVTRGRLCAATSDCNTNPCGALPAEFSRCIVHDGAVACPAGSPFQAAHTVATSHAGQCSACGSGCSIPNPCRNQSVSVFSDSSCKKLVRSFAVDGPCEASGHSGDTAGGVTYTATAATDCVASGTSSASLDADGARTVCCR